MYRSLLKPARLALVSALLLVALPAGAQTTLRIGMTAADVPATTSQPDSGFEGNRFTGLTMFDALTMWDLSSAEKASAPSTPKIMRLLRTFGGGTSPVGGAAQAMLVLTPGR